MYSQQRPYTSITYYELFRSGVDTTPSQWSKQKDEKQTTIFTNLYKANTESGRMNEWMNVCVPSL